MADIKSCLASTWSALVYGPAEGKQMDKRTFPLMWMYKLNNTPPHQAHLLLGEVCAQYRVRMDKDQFELRAGYVWPGVHRAEDGPVTSYTADSLISSVTFPALGVAYR